MSIVPLLSEEQARIYSSDSDEESEENKSQRLPRAKQLSSDEVKANLFNSKGFTLYPQITLWNKEELTAQEHTHVYTFH